MKANRNKILAAIQWLIENNPYYMDLEIDYDALMAYPDNSEDYVQGLNTVVTNPGEDEREAATVYTEEEGHTRVTYSAIPTQVPVATVRQEIEHLVLGDGGRVPEVPQVEWPDRSGPPVTEKTPGFYSMAFPWLPGFCYGRADITVPGRPAGNPQYLAWVGHLLNHPSRAFAQDPRFLLYVVNRYRRDKALTQGNVFVKYGCRDITLAALKEMVAEGDTSIFKRLLYFTRSTIGKYRECLPSVFKEDRYNISYYRLFRISPVFQIRREKSPQLRQFRPHFLFHERNLQPVPHP